MKFAHNLTWFLLIFLSTNFFFGERNTFPLLVSAQCQDHQHSLLLQVKSTLVFNSTESIRLSQWNQTANCCAWSGVECDADGLVIGLDLSNDSISGGIENSTALFSLQYLQRLNLAFNHFYPSQIPSGLGSLTNLTHLNLSHAGFAGQIPVEISSLTRLVFLDLSSEFSIHLNPKKTLVRNLTQLKQLFPDDVFSWLKFGNLYDKYSFLKLDNPNLKTLVRNLGELRELYLDGVNISSQGTEWCQAISSSLYNLQILSMSHCSLSGPLHHSLGSLHSLSQIYLDGNQFLEGTLPISVGNLKNLSVIMLRGCNFSGPIPKSIAKLTQLVELDLSINMFTGPIPESIAKLTHLVKLYLAYNMFTGPIPKSIAKLTHLVKLDLAYNMFTGPIPSLWMSKNLSFFKLRDNRLEGNISSIEWKRLQNLYYLDLESNSLTGDIPPSLFMLPLLRSLYLSNNQFEGQLSNFPNASSSVLDSIDLSGNRLDGSIPLSFFQLRGLQILDLSHNKFNGTIPLQSFERFENLKNLDLSYNRLTVNASSKEILFLPQLEALMLASCNLGIFPNLQNQSKLDGLDLSNNQIGGEIPNWIWNISGESLQFLNLSHNSLRGLQEPYKLPFSLRILDLSSNQLQGKIPLLPIFAEYVDFSSNNFTSTIPAEIGNTISSTYFLSLSNNGFTGEIPNSICNATSLEFLDLSHNALSGGMPQCLMEKTKTLLVLNLKGNNLHGNILNTFSKDCRLQSLNLNGNQLEGGIPKSLANCRTLEVLDIGNNQIGDMFPCWLKTVSSLKILILRSNKFHGPIDCSKFYGAWLDLQIMDLSINNFSGNLPIKSLSTWKTMTVDRDKTQSDAEYLQIFSPFHYGSQYHDAIKITSKGLEMELVRILTVFTSIDLSCNRFEGFIPEEIGNFKSLYALNLSHNALIGVIPSTIGNMKQLESLDLSMNQLTGKIPSQLANLNFLSVLNLSNNHFKGRIPMGTQIQSFPNTSFEGNAGLCGPPLNDCSNTTQHGLDNKVDHQNSEFGWHFALFVGMGFGTGFVVAVAPLICFDKVDLWYDVFVHKLLLHFRK